MAKAVAKKPVLVPLGDRVLIQATKGNTKTAAGIILPEALADDMEMKRGTVVAVGPGRVVDGKLVAVSVKKGDDVIFKKWADKLTFEGEEYFIAGEHDLVATIN
ncbi:MAG: hypothetical protein RL150_194 [Candidatus Parcubacteria bacterium]|jgi:chaperonin GroES